MPRKQKRAFKPMSAPAASASEQELLAADVEQLASGEPAGEILEKPEYDYLADRDAAEIRRLAREVLRRQCEGVALYEPLPEQDAFHKSRARQRIARGGNRAGKTLVASVELARAVTGKDPYHKYPEKDGRAFVVGLDLMHVAQVFYRKLFRPGAFKMIRDEETGKWRAYRPWMQSDIDRKREAKPAPPLIPNRYIQSISWELKSKGIPRVVKLTTGWDVTFFSSQAKPPRGMDLDVVWFDEEIEDEEWYSEMAARLLDRRGCFMWSATPQACNDQLLTLSERAAVEADRHPFERTVEEFVLSLAENPHIDEAEKRTLAELLDEDQYAVRVGGEFAAHRWRVFPEFQQAVHVRKVPDVPPNWTRYAAVDPGHQVCAVLFGAVPDPQAGEPFDLVLYDELYLRQADAAMFGERVAEKLNGQQLELFVIDHQMGRQTQIGTGETVEIAYARELKRNRVRARRSGYGFQWADSNVKGAIEAVRGWLRIQPKTGWPRLVVREGTCPNFQAEIKRYRNKRVKGVVLDEPETRGAVHQMANLRYIVGCHPRFVRPTLAEAETGAYRAFKEKEKRRRKQMGEDVVRLGPGR